MNQPKPREQLDRVIIRFAGDSGDGMQLTGDRFTQESAVFGNDLVTLPNFPAEIRAPQGTIPGVSSFQIHFADHDILTAGDTPDVLVAMNPAALRRTCPTCTRARTIIVDSADFSARNLSKAGYAANPLELLGTADDVLADFHVHAVDLTGMTVEAVKEFELSRKDASRAKNMFALGLLSWMYGRPLEPTIAFLEKKFAQRAGHRRQPTSRHSRPGGTSARRPSRSRSSTRSRRPRSRRAAIATSAATWRWRTG